MILEKFGINGKYFPIKATYLLFYCAYGSLIDFIPLYFKQLGLSAAMVGLMQGVLYLVIFPIRPAVGALSDRTNRHKLLIIGCLVMSIITFALLSVSPWFFPKTNGHDQANGRGVFKCSANVSQIYRPGNCVVSYLCLPCSENLPLRLAKTVPAVNSSLDNCTCNLYFTTNFQVNSSSGVGAKEQSSYKRAICGYCFSSVRSTESSLQTESVLVDENESYNATTTGIDGEQDILAVYNETYTHNGTLPNLYIHIRGSTWVSAQNGKLIATLFVFFILSGVFRSPITDLLNVVAYFSLEDRNDFGRVRLWGCIGNCIMSPVSASLMDKLGHAGKDDYSVCFYLYIAFGCVAVVFCSCTEASSKQYGDHVTRNFSGLLRNPKIMRFLALAIAISINSKGLTPFLFWYMKDIGSSQLTVGLAISLRLFVEVLCMYISGTIINRFGHNSCLYAISGMLAFRCLCYSLITNPWFMLPVEIISGVIFGLTSTVLPIIANIISPPGMEATLQTLTGACRSGLGKAIGAFAAGALMDNQTGVGPVWTFRIFGIFSAVVLIVNVAISKLYLKDYEPQVNSQSE